MGGEITAESKGGAGTVFKFDIQVAIAEQPPIAATDKATDKIEKTKQWVMPTGIILKPGQPPYRILIVDDLPANRRILVQLLSPLGFELREANSGEEAVEIWATWQPQLIWMDIRLSGISGLKSTKIIKERSKKEDLQPTAIIALSALVRKEEKKEALAAGCDDFVAKPFKESLIFEKLQEHIGVKYKYDPAPASLE